MNKKLYKLRYFVLAVQYSFLRVDLVSDIREITLFFLPSISVTVMKTKEQNIFSKLILYEFWQFFTFYKFTNIQHAGSATAVGHKM